MPKMYRSITDLYNEVLSFTIIDLLPHVSTLSQDLMSALVDTSTGLYLPGSIEPMFENQTSYLLINSLGRPTGQVVTTDQIRQDIEGKINLPPGNFINDEKKQFVKRMLYEKFKHKLSYKTNVPIKGCEAAIATVVSTLNSLCKFTNVAHRRYQLETLIKPSRHKLIELEEYENAFHDLYVEVMKFVGLDTWSYYYYHIKGTSLVIEKGLDFRIVEWHKQQIEDHEAFDHDANGIIPGYEIGYQNREPKKRKRH